MRGHCTKGTRIILRRNFIVPNLVIRSLFDLLKQVFNVHPQLIEDDGVREMLNEFSQLITTHAKDEASAAPLTLLIKSIVSLGFC